MGLNIEREGRIMIVTAEGRVDGANAQEFQQDLAGAIDESDRAVVLDLGKCHLHQQRRPAGYSDDCQSA